MEKRLQIQAAHKNGILQLLEALPPGSVSQEVAGYFSPEEWAQAAQDAVSLDKVAGVGNHLRFALRRRDRSAGRALIDCQTTSSTPAR